MDKDEVVECLNDIATLLELKGENPFKSRAYVNAARSLEACGEPVEKLVAENRLGELQGIGEAIQKKIAELVTTGKLAYYENLKASIPDGLRALLEVPGLGPKKIKVLHDQLGIRSVEQLEAACQEGKVATLKGFGPKTQSNICEGIRRRREYASKHLLIAGLALAEPVLESLRDHPDVIRCSIAGSLRRFKEVIGDIDFLASSKKPARVLAFFTQLPGIEKIIAQGDTKASVVFRGGIQADLRVVSDPEYPFALAYFTGSKEHNIVMRQRAIARGLRLNEYGLFRSEVETRDPALRVNCRTEEEIYAELGLAHIEPELREDHGEFKASEEGKLPRLLDWHDLKGSLHNHSTYSDGHNRLEDIVAYMRELGCAYWGIADHSQSSWQAHGLDARRLAEQIKEIREINQRLTAEDAGFKLLAGIEVDILADGKLDFPDEILAQLDVVIASIHQRSSADEAETTERVIRATQNPYVHMIGHLTGRLLLQREPYAIDQRAVIDACAATGTWLELNASPNRLELDWRLWPYAKSKGVKCVINCDAHWNEQAHFLRLGAAIARKGWLEKGDVINTLPLPQLKRALDAKRGKARKPK
jgi:DNA polymerase (family 10)